MKKLLFLLIAIIVCVNANAGINTTIKVDATKVAEKVVSTVKKEHNDVALDASTAVKVVEDVTTNSKGKQVTKYYCVIKGELYSTSKTVAEYVYLCERLQVTPRLAIRDGKKIVKL